MSDWRPILGKFIFNTGKHFTRKRKAAKARASAEAEYGDAVADAVEAAVKAGRDPGPILRQAKRALEARRQRDAILINPPPLYGSSAWARESDVTPVLRPDPGYDDPSSILLGGWMPNDQANPSGFLHWDADGHLMTLAPTRSGKALTTLIPNLLRYRGSAVVLDPKGELYETTSKWRRENVGPVYRLAPFDDGTDTKTSRFPRHGYNPLHRIRTQAQARTLAEQMFPRDPRSPEFFTDDAAAFVTGMIMFILDQAPPANRNLAAVLQLCALELPDLERTLRNRVAKSKLSYVRNAAASFLEKSERSRKTLRETIHSKFALWSDDYIYRVLARHDFEFETLKERPATVYIVAPFTYMKPYAPWLRIVLKDALDAMISNTAIPSPPVLFVLDEFQQLGPFPEFRDAIRMHAGSGVRLWFAMQSLPTLEENYPNGGWRTFFDCSVKQFFGVRDPFTAEMISRYLGTKTLAWMNTNAGGNVSAQLPGQWSDAGGAGVSISTGESVQLLGRPLMTPDEVKKRLSPWLGDGVRDSILDLENPAAPVMARLTVFDKDPEFLRRSGAYVEGGQGDE